MKEMEMEKSRKATIFFIPHSKELVSSVRDLKDVI